MATPDQPAADVFLPNGLIDPHGFDARTATALDASIRFARDTNWDSVRTPHLFMGLLADPDPGVCNWGQRLGADLPRLLEQFRDLFRQDAPPEDAALKLHREFLSDNVIRVLREARYRAVEQGRPCVSAIDLLISLFTAPNSIVAECFERVGVAASRLAELALMAEQQRPEA